MFFRSFPWFAGHRPWGTRQRGGEMAREVRADSSPVSDEGDAVKRRRERLGWNIGELADAAGVNRDTVSAIEAGEGFRRSSLTKIENALQSAEDEAGISAPPAPAAGLVEIEVDGDRIVVRGPVTDPDLVVDMVARLLAARDAPKE